MSECTYSANRAKRAHRAHGELFRYFSSFALESQALCADSPLCARMCQYAYFCAVKKADHAQMNAMTRIPRGYREAYSSLIYLYIEAVSGKEDDQKTGLF